jgi:hypothetical protein
MMSNQWAIALAFLATLLIAILAWANSLTEQQNAELFAATGKLKSPRYLVVIFLILGLLCSVMAIATDHHRSTDVTWPMGLFGLAGMVVIWIRSFFGVQLDSNVIRFGWRCHRAVAYSDVAGLERRSDGREAVLVLVLHSGARRRIGSSLSCEKMFIDELQRRTGCTVTYLRGGRVVPEPEWLVLQSNYEKFKSRIRK